MTKLKAVIILIILAPILGAIYGVLHDQITFSISSEYYTKFKFYQFRIAKEGLVYHPDNVRSLVSLVGILATWWVGLIIGIVLSAVGLIHKNGPEILKAGLRSLLITFFVAIIFGVFGYLFAKYAFTDYNLNSELMLRLNNPLSFFRVGMIHNFSYLGGGVGLIIGIINSLMMRKKFKHSN